jgi:hypothetical protein
VTDTEKFQELAAECQRLDFTPTETLTAQVLMAAQLHVIRMRSNTDWLTWGPAQIAAASRQ